MDKLMDDFLDRLVSITKNCRPDMHEPDEQGVDAIVMGNQFNNSSGNVPYFPMRSGTVYPYFELTICIFKNVEYEWFNLATLVAAARMVPNLLERIDELEKEELNETEDS